MKIDAVIQKEDFRVQPELKEIFQKFPKDAEVEIKRISKGEYLVKEGEPSYYVYFILSGEVTPQYFWGNNAFVAKRLKKNSIIGDIAVLGNLERYSTSVMTLTECRVLAIRGADYWKWALQDEKFLKGQVESVIEILLGELTNKRYMESETLDNRLLNYFVWYCRKEGMEYDQEITVKKTRDQMADEIGGISVRTINRKLLRFAEQGFITVDHGKIKITYKQVQQMQHWIWGN